MPDDLSQYGSRGIQDCLDALATSAQDVSPVSPTAWKRLIPAPELLEYADLLETSELKSLYSKIGRLIHTRKKEE